jgi:hypothetical protein
MNIFRRFLNLFRPKEHFPEMDDEWEEISYGRANVDMNDQRQRREYILDCLEQLKEATIEISNLESEYTAVNSQLQDMEEIEALPKAELTELKKYAERLLELGIERGIYEEDRIALDEEIYQKIDALQDQAEEGLNKLTEAEGYHAMVKLDMKRLTGEREAYNYRKNEIKNLLADLRAMLVVCLTAAGVCIALLLVLQLVFAMNTQIGYILLVGAVAVALTYIFIKNNEAKRDLKRVEKTINKIILLHNSVKIRYVNNNNLLEYLRIKYGVKNAAELKKIYDQYLEEKERRDEFRRMEQEMDIVERDFLRILRRYKISDPIYWLHNLPAVLEPKKMAELRHSLIIRRQSLRKNMEYNRGVVAKKIQYEIKEIVAEDPAYATEILALVADYERKYN